MSETLTRWRWGDPVETLRATLATGGMLAIPTESTYGLGVDPRDDRGVQTVFRCKRRSISKALPVVLGDLEQLRMLGGDPDVPELQEIAALWPAALTVVVPIERPLPATGGEHSLAIRIPDHAALRALLLDLGHPLTASSANPSGHEPVSRVEMLIAMLADWNCVIVDEGDLRGGPPSTIVRPEGPGYRVLREAAISHQWLAARLNRPLFSATPAEIPADDRPQTA